MDSAAFLIGLCDSTDVRWLLAGSILSGATLLVAESSVELAMAMEVFLPGVLRVLRDELLRWR